MRDLSVRRLNRKWGELFIPTCGWVKFRVSLTSDMTQSTPH
ncbi:hypothetical protein AB6A68_14850 [Ferrimicrobium acidiphilum]|uniref:Uncharacterized protein n=1 Tax=Ferrimicrobium acidiphilum TaxID=121039 RepID=A0ABV3Y688_9ACTN